MHRRNPFSLLAICVAIVMILPWGRAEAQNSSEPRPIDMMVVIDNSCSMFPREQIVSGCESWGSDPSFLRIAGADLFIARLGFGSPDEAEYQLGVVSLGEDPVLVSPLQQLADLRDQLASQIAQPKAQTATKLIPALEMAYSQMRTSPNRDSSHMPAVVLITDGVPYPPEGQSNQDIVQLVSSYPDIPLFVMLLQNKADPSPDYENFISFWNQLETRFNHIFVYRIEKAAEIETTYNAILGQIQGTIPAASVNLDVGTGMSFKVGQYVQRVIVTVIQNSNQDRGEVTIVDPDGDAIKPDEPGVNVFQGQENPVEVYSIAAPRLKDELRVGLWNISSTSSVSVIIDREGGYHFNFLSPETKTTDISDIFQVSDRQSPSQELIIRFNLLTWGGEPVLDSQEVQGEVITPEGKQLPLNISNILPPNSEGNYEIRVDLTQFSSTIQDKPGRFTFNLRAGVVDETAGRLPITTARLIVDAGRMPYIRSVSPSTLLCAAGKPAELQVMINDYDVAKPDSLGVKVLDGEESINLGMIEPGSFSADLTELCKRRISQANCSVSKLENVALHVDFRMEGEEIALPLTKSIPVQVEAPKCTPTPIPSPTPTAAPSPTPVPDSDHDGMNNLDDKCPAIPGLRSEGGCIPYDKLGIGLGILGVVLASANWGWPWVKVRTFDTPPDGFITVFREGSAPEGPYSIHEIGMKRKTSRIIIGGSRRKSHLYVEGLRPAEFVVERKSVITSLRDPQIPEPFAFFDDDVQLVRTSEPKVKINICLDREKLVK